MTAHLQLVCVLLIGLSLRPAVSGRSRETSADAVQAEEDDDHVGDDSRYAHGHQEGLREDLGRMHSSPSHQVGQERPGREQWCSGWSSGTMRWFYFLIDQYAVVLVRSPRSPRLIFYENAIWDVRLTGDRNMKLDWMLRPREPGLAVGPPVEIDLLFDVHYIRRLDGNQTRPARPGSNGSDDELEHGGLEIVFTNGTVLSFTGGLNLHAPLIEQVVESLDQNLPDTSAMEAVRASSRTNGSIFHTVVGRVMDSVRRKTDVASLLGLAGTHAVAGAYGSNRLRQFLGGLVADFVGNGGWARTMDVMNVCLAFTPMRGLSGVFGTHSGLATLAYPTPAALLVMSLRGAAVGAATGMALGLAAGIAAGLATEAYSSIWEWLEQRGNVDLTASDMIYKKLWCHKSFARCCKGEVLVPLGAKCPELPSCETETEEESDDEDEGIMAVYPWT